MTLYLILFVVTFFSIGLAYGAVARLTERWLIRRGWRVRDVEEERIGWEPEDIYNLPPSIEWLTLWEAYRAQRRLKK